MLENAVYKDLSTHVENNNVIPECQSAYRKFHSTETALIKIFDDILPNMAQGKNTMLISLDLSAAYDTIKHKFMLKTLENYGVEKTALTWLQSYLTGRKTKVVVDNKESEDIPLEVGLAQGGVLSPLLYSIYTADITSIFNKHKMNYHIYADDIQIYFNIDDRSEKQITEDIKSVMTDIKIWMLQKYLKLNTEKTELIIIGQKRKLVEVPFKKINLEKTEIELKTSIKNVGCILDENLTMDKHTTEIARKCNIQLYKLNKIRKFITQDTAKQLIETLVIPHIEFQSALLYKIKKDNLKKLNNILRRSVRYIYKLNKRTHLEPYFYKLNWLPLLARIEHKLARIILPTLQREQPKYLYKILAGNIDNDRPNETRAHSNRDMLTQRPKSELHRRSITICSPKIYNSIPAEMREENHNKHILKKHYLEASYSNEDNFSENYKL